MTKSTPEELRRLTICPECEGKGQIYGTEWSTGFPAQPTHCYSCRGRGTIDFLCGALLRKIEQLEEQLEKRND